jgi:hypothetical protein
MTTTYTLDQAVNILEGRASRYGGNISDILNITPQSMWDNPDELVDFWDGRDLSHIMPKSVYPDMANDWSNIMPEDPSVNRARGAEIMTDSEALIAEMDNEARALILEWELQGDSVEILTEVIELAGQ